MSYSLLKTISCQRAARGMTQGSMGKARPLSLYLRDRWLVYFIEHWRRKVQGGQLVVWEKACPLVPPACSWMWQLESVINLRLILVQSVRFRLGLVFLIKKVFKLWISFGYARIISPTQFIFVFRFYLKERERAQVSRRGRKQALCWARNPTRGSIPEPWDHEPSLRQTLNWITQVPLWLNLLRRLFFHWTAFAPL